MISFNHCIRKQRIQWRGAGALDADCKCRWDMQYYIYIKPSPANWPSMNASEYTEKKANTRIHYKWLCPDHAHIHVYIGYTPV